MQNNHPETLVSTVSSSFPWTLEEVDTNSARTNLLKSSEPDKPRKKLIHFMRHAQGHHNVAGEANYADYELEAYEDATLSPLGTEQCGIADQAYNKIMKDVPLVVVSMMRRCMETAIGSFPSLLNNDGVRWVANENIREQTGSHPCDRRLSTAVYKETFPKIDFSEIEHDEDPFYWKYGNGLREPPEHVLQRCRAFLDWIVLQPEQEILVCSHSAVLGILIPLLDTKTHFKKFQNAELRSYYLHWES